RASMILSCRCYYPASVSQPAPTILRQLSKCNWKNSTATLGSCLAKYSRGPGARTSRLSRLLALPRRSYPAMEELRARYERKGACDGRTSPYLSLGFQSVDF